MKMAHRFRWWLVGNLVCFLVVPMIFGIWLSAEVDAGYASGARKSSAGDSLSIPVAGVALANGVLLLGINGSIGLVLLIGRAVKIQHGQSGRV